MSAAQTPGPRGSTGFGRRRLIGAAVAAGALAAGAVGVRWAVQEDEPSPAERNERRERAEREQRDERAERVAELRSEFFDGPVADRVDLDSLDPHRRPETTQLGLNAAFQHLKETPDRGADDMLPFAIAAGVKWLRTGHRTKEWDWQADRPAEIAERYVRAEAEVGLKPLLQVDAVEYIGKGDFVDRWVDLASRSIRHWGDKVGAVQFDNEPHSSWSAVYGGDYRGGPWLSHYARFVQQASLRLKREFPDVPLINGAHLPSVAIQQLTMARARNLDAIDWHLYSFKEKLPPEYTKMAKADIFPKRASKHDEVERVAVDYRRRARRMLRNGRLQLWVTETGLPSTKPGFSHDPVTAPIGDQAQAKWMARTLPLLLPVTGKLFVYSLWDQGAERPDRNAFYGLVTDRLRPKPAYYVLGRISALTGGKLTTDPAFRARVSNLRLGGTPRFRRVMGSDAHPSNQVVVRERIRVTRLIGANRQAMLAIWSTHPIREDFQPRRARIEVNTPLGPRPIVVDPMTGESRELVTDGGTSFELEIRDYPLFILTDDAAPDAGDSI